MATHPSILAWRIPWTDSLTGYSPWGHKENNMTERLLLLTIKLIRTCMERGQIGKTFRRCDGLVDL